MSFDDGWSALNLEMPSRVPRTEYSAHRHWDLLSQVNGEKISHKDSPEKQQKAGNLFRSPKGWNYDLVWSTHFHLHHLGKFRTDMGHASYDSGGEDFREQRLSWCSSPEDVLAFEPEKQLPIYDYQMLILDLEKAYQQNCKDVPDAVNMTGIYITLVSGLLEIFGWDNLLMAMGLDPQGFGKVAASYAKWTQQFFNAMADSNVPVVMVHDDIVWTSGPFTSPQWYRDYIFPHYKNYLVPLLDAGKKVLFTSDGNYNHFIDDIAKTGVHGFVMEPCTDMSYIAEKYGKTHSFIGNGDTRVLLTGNNRDIKNEVKRCMDIGKKCPGFIMAVGNHIPSNTPVDKALYYNKIYQELSQR